MNTDLINGYVDALGRNDVRAVLGILSPDAVFQSPFHTWRGRSLRKVYAARAIAFEDTRFEGLVRDTDRAALLWRATVAGAGGAVQACEVVTLLDAEISRIDAFLRPAMVLPAVRAAMTRAWPAS